MNNIEKLIAISYNFAAGNRNLPYRRGASWFFRSLWQVNFNLDTSGNFFNYIFKIIVQSLRFNILFLILNMYLWKSLENANWVM